MNDQATIGILDQFQTDLVDAWRRLPNKGLFLALLAAWLALFQFLGNSTFGYLKTPSLLSWMYQLYTGWSPGGDEDRQGLWIPVIVLGVFWWKRNELLALPLKVWWPGLLLILLGLVLHVVGYSIQQARVSVLGLFTGIYGLMGIAWGPAWLRASFFPFFLFVFCVPFSTLITRYTVPLQVLVCIIVEFISHQVLAIDVLRSGTQLFDPMGQYQYEVAAACSGIRSLITIGTVATIVAFLFCRSWWRRILLMSSAVPLAVIGNVLRLLTIVISAAVGGQDVGNYVHEGGPGGVISLMPYIPAFLGLMALSNWLKEPTAPESKPV
jgi:exosortase